MSYVPDMEYARLIIAHRLPLKNMTRDVGELYLDKYLPELTEEQREFTLELCGQKIAPLKDQPRDPLFVAAMFMAGVSQGDLALLFGVRKQTIQSKIYNCTTKAERETMRDRPDNIDLESVAVARDMYYMMCEGNTELSKKSATELGRLLLNAANAIMAKERGDELIAPRPRRYSGLNTSTGKEEAAALVAQAHEKMESDEYHEPLLEQPAEPEVSSEQPAQPSSANVVRPDEQAFLDSL